MRLIRAVIAFYRLRFASWWWPAKLFLTFHG
jgi:hypothetical protein